ncbi:MAG: serine hydrolase domain-containing protein [Acidobacteriota bacterium]
MNKGRIFGCLTGCAGLAVAVVVVGAYGWQRTVERIGDPASERRPPPAEAMALPLGLDSLDGYLEEVRQRHALPALAAAFGRSDGPLAAGAVGVRRAGSHQAIELDDRFHLGSCTKAMTATLLALSVEAGDLAWSSTLGEVFPDLAAGFAPAYREVTVEQLLLHRSGLGDDRRPDRQQMAMLRGLTGPLDEQRREALTNILAIPPKHPPGRRMEYSNEGYIIAGAVAEAITGRPWEELLQERLFAPLGMTSAGFGPPGTVGAVDQPWGHRELFGIPLPVGPGPFADNPPVLGPAGTVHATILDFLTWGTFHLRGARGEGTLLAKTTFARLHEDSRNQEYALGWGVKRDSKGHRTLAHAGSNTAFLAAVRVLPERDLVAVVATNSGAPRGQDAVREVLEHLTRE